MVLLTQTSWQEFTLKNVMEILRYAPLNLAISKNPVLYYTLPNELINGAIVNYNLQCGFKCIKWTGIISSVVNNHIIVRLGEGPFRGFTGSHHFLSEGIITACYDEFSFQGFISNSEEVFEQIISKTNVMYGIHSRINTREIILSYENQKSTKAFESLENSVTAG